MERYINNSGYFGIKYLDAALHGIKPNDLILIGASSGAGKTELCTHIAKTNAKLGKRVRYIALEAEKNEIENRILFSEVCKKWYQTEKFKLLYDDFIYGEYDNKLITIKQKIQTQIDIELANLDVYYRDSDHFSETELETYINHTFKDTDLYIIDHLHYFDINPSINENSAYKSLLKRIRDIVLLYNKPVILIAHLRKKEKGENYVVPLLDSFHGSSDIYKIATKVITMKNAEIEGLPKSLTEFPTIFYTAKNRTLGITTKTIGIQMFDITTNEYKNEVYIADLSQGFTKVQFYKDANYLPIWCQRRLINEFKSI